MNIKIQIKGKQQLLFIVLGAVIGLIIGVLLSNYMEFDTVQTLQETARTLGEELSVRSASDLIQFQKTAALYGPVLFCSGLFNGTYLFINWVKYKTKKIIILSMILFPFMFIVIMFVGILSLIPFIIYDFYLIIKS